MSEPRPSSPQGFLRSPSGHVLMLIAVTGALFLPFVGKAFHMDDPLFLWAAAQIHQHPTDFYGFNVNWYGTPQPMHFVMKNPPLASYYLALAANLLGWREIALHSASLVWPIAVVLGVWRLARWWTHSLPHASLAALLTVASPIFFVSSTNVMCDTMMLALWVWAVVLWIEAIDKGGGWRFTGAGLLIAASALTKYFGICLIPLLLVYSGVSRRRIGASIAAMAIPALALAWYQLRTGDMYGKGLLLDAFAYAKAVDTSAKEPRWTKAVIGLVFAGGCIAPVALLMTWLITRRVAAIAGVVSLAIVVLMCMKWRDQPRFMAGDAPDWAKLAQASVWVCVAVFAALFAFAELNRRRDAATVLLFLWLGGAWLFSTFVNWTINARTIMPMAPAIALLAVRRLSDVTANASTDAASGDAPAVTSAPPWRWAWALAAVPSIVLCLAVAQADRSVADAGREGVAMLMNAYSGAKPRLYFNAHWGPQYYFQQAGVASLDWAGMRLEPGDTVLIADHNTNTWALPREALQAMPKASIPLMPGLTTHRTRTGAGFYSDQVGPLPFAFGRVEPATFPVYRVTRPIDIAAGKAVVAVTPAAESAPASSQPDSRRR